LPSARDGIVFRNILVVDDEENIRDLLRAVLSAEGWIVDTAGSAGAALLTLESKTPDLILSDVRMAGMTGLELLTEVHRRDPSIVVVMMSAYGSVDAALLAMKQGAYDYVAKPFRPDEVVLVIRKAEERRRLQEENSRLRSDLQQLRTDKDVRGLGPMVARSDVMDRLFKTVRKIGEYKTTVLVQGESGTGKELVARAIHDLSPRAAGPFIPVNCGAFPENLLASELFGHRRGAFTDATRDKKGLFEEANGGTVFLDEIGELPLGLQVKLLRVLQEEEIRRVGDNRSTTIDVRIVAATVRDLAADVAAGRFREDLYYRLNVVPLVVPALRDRLEDVPLLVDHFVSLINKRLGTGIARVSAEALRALATYHWPGNVRELENTLEHAIVLAESEDLKLGDLPPKLGNHQADPLKLALASGDLSIKKASKFIEKELIRRALAQTGGNKTAASRLLEISHRALLYKIKEYGLGAGIL
jgi:two-component system response regulator AtoC